SFSSIWSPNSRRLNRWSRLPAQPPTDTVARFGHSRSQVTNSPDARPSRVQPIQGDLNRSITKEIIRSDKVTPPKAPLSPAVRAGDFIFVSGQPAFFGDRQIAKDDFDAQMHQVMANIKALLEEAGSSLDKIVKANVILKNASDFAR